MLRTSCLAQALWVFFLVSLVLPSRVASAQTDLCPAFTVEQIDYAFDAWSEFIGLIPENTNFICYDDPIIPATRLEVDGDRDQDASFMAFVQRDVAGCSMKIMGEIMHCTKSNTKTTWHIPDGQICRTQILHSTAWRQYCKDEAVLGRSQEIK
jgi:hypothetical protein